MSNFLNAKRFGPFLLSFAISIGLPAMPPANAISSSNSGSNSGARFISEVATSPEPMGLDERQVVKAARIQLIQNAAKWGIDPTQFQSSLVIAGVAGISIVRFTQSINDVEVANSLLAITVDKNGSLLSYMKSVSDFSGVSQAIITKAQATELLKSKLTHNNGVSPDQVSVSEIKLVIVDSALVDDVPLGKYLAWRASTSISNNANSISMTYLSQDGQRVLSTLPFVRKITADPFVCDLQVDRTTPGYVPPVGVTIDGNGNRNINIALAAQGMPLCGVNTFGLNAPNAEVGKINIMRTWNYFSTVLGQDINEEKYLGNVASVVNGDSTPRISAFIDICETNGSCPYNNAFWIPWTSNECASGACSGIFLGKTFDHADDVIAHELAHGVTFALAFSSPMAENSETAALSEATSDIFGEAMDQLSVLPGEIADPAWRIGEDVKAGGFRNLQNPSVSKIDSKWVPGDSHENSGPVNRLAYVLANGGKIGNVEIKALGSNANSITKNDLCDAAGECLGTVRISQLVFATASNLSATATYFDFGRAMNNACVALQKAKTTGFTITACKSVQSALTAQGFTSASIKIKKISAKSKTTKPLVLSATMTAINGTKISGQKLALQVLVGSKWVTKQSRITDESGKASFSINLKSKRKFNFRVTTYSYSGLYSIKSTDVSTTVS